MLTKSSTIQCFLILMDMGSYQSRGCSELLIYLVAERKEWNIGGSLSPVPPLIIANLQMIPFDSLHLVFVLSHCLPLLQKFLPTHNTAVPAFLFYSHPAGC